MTTDIIIKLLTLMIMIVVGVAQLPVGYTSLGVENEENVNFPGNNDLPGIINDSRYQLKMFNRRTGLNLGDGQNVQIAANSNDDILPITPSKYRLSMYGPVPSTSDSMDNVLTSSENISPRYHKTKGVQGFNDNVLITEMKKGEDGVVKMFKDGNMLTRYGELLPAHYRTPRKVRHFHGGNGINEMENGVRESYKGRNTFANYKNILPTHYQERRRFDEVEGGNKITELEKDNDVVNPVKDGNTFMTYEHVSPRHGAKGFHNANGDGRTLSEVENNEGTTHIATNTDDESISEIIKSFESDDNSGNINHDGRFQVLSSSIN